MPRSTLRSYWALPGDSSETLPSGSGRPRAEAIARMERALREFEVVGVRTTIPLHRAILENAFFRRGEVYTNFVQRRVDLRALARP